jgi:hypothetical protein
MPLQVVTHGTNQQFINGIPVVNKRYNLSLDTKRSKSKQVNADIIDNDKHYKLQDSLEHFLQKMSSKKLSLFDFLENEKKISTLNNEQYKSYLNSIAKYETVNSAKQTRKIKRNKNKNKNKNRNTRRVKRNRKLGK